MLNRHHAFLVAYREKFAKEFEQRLLDEQVAKAKEAEEREAAKSRTVRQASLALARDQLEQAAAKVRRVGTMQVGAEGRETDREGRETERGRERKAKRLVSPAKGDREER